MDYTLGHNTKGLDKLKKGLMKALVVKIGILNGSKERNDNESNAEIGLKQEFGSITENIPARSFLRMPIESHKKELREFISKSKKVKAALERGEAVKALELMGTKAEDIIQQAFETGGFGKWAANSPTTIQLKGSSNPLIDTGQLRRAIMFKVDKKQ